MKGMSDKWTCRAVCSARTVVVLKMAMTTMVRTISSQFTCNIDQNGVHPVNVLNLVTSECSKDIMRSNHTSGM